MTGVITLPKSHTSQSWNTLIRQRKVNRNETFSLTRTIKHIPFLTTEISVLSEPSSRISVKISTVPNVKFYAVTRRLNPVSLLLTQPSHRIQIPTSQPNPATLFTYITFSLFSQSAPKDVSYANNIRNGIPLFLIVDTFLQRIRSSSWKFSYQLSSIRLPLLLLTPNVINACHVLVHRNVRTMWTKRIFFRPSNVFSRPSASIPRYFFNCLFQFPVIFQIFF